MKLTSLIRAARGVLTRVAAVAVLFNLSDGLRAQAATSYSFTLPASATTSAGVFKPDGTLVRTLWRKVTYSAGTHTSSASTAPLNWDDKDDNGNLMPSGIYQVRVLCNNVTYTWEGVIGNTSASFTGPGVHYNYLPISAITFSGTNGYYCAGYDETRYDFTRFNTSDPQTTIDHFVTYYSTQSRKNVNRAADITDRSWCFAASDSSCVYFAAPNSWDPTITTTTASTAGKGFVSKYYFGDGSTVPYDSVAYFTGYTNAQQEVPSGPINTTGWGDGHQYRPFASGLLVGTQPGVSGMAVQFSTHVLAVSVGVDNKVYLFDKGTGLPLSTASITVTNPGNLAFGPTGDLWVISGTSVQRYAYNASTGLLATSPATTISGFSEPVAVAADPRTGYDIVLVADAGTSQQVKGYTSSGTAASGWSAALGQAGGYTTGTNSTALANDKFWFTNGVGAASYSGSGSYIGFQSDGSFWVVDEGNSRVEHFSAAKSYLGQIAYRTIEYAATVDQNNPTRIFTNWREYSVDYTKSLTPGDPGATGGNGSWKLSRNYGPSVESNTNYLLYTNLGMQGLQTVVTLNNNRTWGLVNRTDAKRELVELTPTGIIFTGTNYTGALLSGSATLYANGEIRDYTRGTNTATLTQRKIKFDTAGNPSWDAATTLATMPYGVSGSVTNPTFDGRVFPTASSYPTHYPTYWTGYDGISGPRFPSSSSGVIIALDSSNYSNPNYGMHLGGFLPGGSTWLWAASPAIDTGGVAKTGLLPDGLGSYSYDADNFGGWAATTAWTVGQNVIYNYNGQWSNFMNQFMHFWDDGLFVGQFGVGGGELITWPDAGPPAGFASNAISPTVIRGPGAQSGSLYAYQGDEMIHAATHRWRIDGADSIYELYGSGPMDGGTAIAVNTQTTTSLNQDFETGTIGNFVQVTSSGGTGTTLSPTTRPPDGSLHVGMLGMNQSGYVYTKGGLTTGNVVTFSCDVNNDDTSGDSRGVGITVFAQIPGGASRRFDQTTTALHTWQHLSITVTLQPGETTFVGTVQTGFNHAHGFVDNLKTTITH